MKKFFVLMMAMTCVIMAMACGTDPEEVDGTTGATQQTGGDGDGTAKSGKSLVVFFSRADENYNVGYVERGNTAKMVDAIIELADVETFEILPEVAYPSDYQECITYVNDIEVPQNLRPKYKNDPGDLSAYDNVFIGGPIWWGRPPYIIRTFLEAHPELAHKHLIPFGTHAGSGVSSYTSLLQEYFPEASILEALGISGVTAHNNASSTRSSVESWLKRIGLDHESTDIQSVRQTRATGAQRYSLNGTRYAGNRDIYIENEKKYVKQ